MIVTIFTTISQKGDLGEDFDEDPLRHAFHDRFGPKPGGGPRGPEGYRRPPGPFQEISRAGRRASRQRGIARRDAREPGRLPSFPRCQVPSRWPTSSPPPRTAWSCSTAWGRSLPASAPRTAVSSRVGRPSSGDRRLSLRAHPRRRRLFRRRCQLVIYHQTSFAYHV